GWVKTTQPRSALVHNGVKLSHQAHKNPIKMLNFVQFAHCFLCCPPAFARQNTPPKAARILLLLLQLQPGAPEQ
ncbi:MAG TPA: hypothetical protein VES70_14435, partial [Pseudomonas sp.]|nr:hypothetical protein [Pseudomonas sp.]